MKVLFQKTMAIVALTAVYSLFTGGSLCFAQKGQAEPNAGVIRFASGADVVSAYHLRGLIFEDNGLIMKPWAAAQVNLHTLSGHGLIERVNFKLLALGSIHSEGTTATHSPRSFYEADGFAGLQVITRNNWNLEVGVHHITWPSGTRDAAAELYARVGYDDQVFWMRRGVAVDGFTGLRPWAMIEHEVDNTFMGMPGKRKSSFVSLGIEPAFTLVESEKMPVTLNLPITVGFGLRDYYGTRDSSFGYTKLGVIMEMPLSYVPERYGRWKMKAGVDLIWIGDSPRQYNQDHQSFMPVAVVGLAMFY